GTLIEWRSEQQNQAVVAAHKATLHFRHCLAGAGRIARSGKDRPRLRQGIDLALIVACRAQRRSVVEVSPSVPRPIPSLLLDRWPEALGLGPPAVGAGSVAALFGN